ncbi:BT_3987 domain-containing protein [Rhizosphaericola mali]|uniref:DUF1735 domain-containing protein n=1 Tax=Rhizosphaericola mali TaxID=2545455 RepID=A0A5P2G025_9BACT|nr:DUF1735 domain-containing protein [Rhizosphaericola mali]QES87140.1 DUF1735 domain-containing protein [Rhizosphaericola mali]
MTTLYMYLKKGLTIFLILGVLICVFIASCVKDNKLYSPEEGNIYMPQAYADKANLSLFVLDTPQVITLGAAYSGFNSASTNIQADFEVDTSLIAAYNTEYEYLGYHYYAIPDSAYDLSALTTTLKAGTTTSDPISLSITTSKLLLGRHYLLPIRLKSVSLGKLDTSLSIAYFKIDTLSIRSKDITSSATFSFNYDDAPSYGDAGESASHLVDSNYTTKYLLFTYHPDMYVQLRYSQPTVINAYTLTSGGDAPERDPRDWTFEGSNDGTSWTVLDTRTYQSFANRTETIQFNTSNTTAYSIYRLNITSNNNGGSGLFQCAEWRLLQFY